MAPAYPTIILQSAEVGVTKIDSKSVAYENRTKNAKCGGLETNGPRERISGADGCAACGGFRDLARVLRLGDLLSFQLSRRIGNGVEDAAPDRRVARDANPVALGA